MDLGKGGPIGSHKRFRVFTGNSLFLFVPDVVLDVLYQTSCCIRHPVPDVLYQVPVPDFWPSDNNMNWRCMQHHQLAKVAKPVLVSYCIVCYL